MSDSVLHASASALVPAFEEVRWQRGWYTQDDSVQPSHSAREGSKGTCGGLEVKMEHWIILELGKASWKR